MFCFRKFDYLFIRHTKRFHNAPLVFRRRSFSSSFTLKITGKNKLHQSITHNLLTNARTTMTKWIIPFGDFFKFQNSAVVMSEHCRIQMDYFACRTVQFNILTRTLLPRITTKWGEPWRTSITKIKDLSTKPSLFPYSQYHMNLF